MAEFDSYKSAAMNKLDPAAGQYAQFDTDSVVQPQQAYSSALQEAAQYVEMAIQQITQAASFKEQMVNAARDMAGVQGQVQGEVAGAVGDAMALVETCSQAAQAVAQLGGDLVELAQSQLARAQAALSQTQNAEGSSQSAGQAVAGLGQTVDSLTVPDTGALDSLAGELMQLAQDNAVAGAAQNVESSTDEAGRAAAEARNLVSEI